jgi:hypothetical protein
MHLAYYRISIIYELRRLSGRFKIALDTLARKPYEGGSAGTVPYLIPRGWGFPYEPNPP